MNRLHLKQFSLYCATLFGYYCCASMCSWFCDFTLVYTTTLDSVKSINLLKFRGILYQGSPFEQIVGSNRHL